MIEHNKLHGQVISYCLKVSVSVIPYLETNDWERLGVGAVGDRVVLVQLSKAQLSK